MTARLDNRRGHGGPHLDRIDAEGLHRPDHREENHRQDHAVFDGRGSRLVIQEVGLRVLHRQASHRLSPRAVDPAHLRARDLRKC